MQKTQFAQFSSATVFPHSDKLVNATGILLNSMANKRDGEKSSDLIYKRECDVTFILDQVASWTMSTSHNQSLNLR